MRFGVAYHTGHYGVDPDAIVAYARHAEAGGFESLYLSEHVVLYRGATMGAVAIDPTAPIVAAATDRILLGTGVLQLPHHHPVVLAKRLATIDALSKGRMRLLTAGRPAVRRSSWQGSYPRPKPTKGDRTLFRQVNNTTSLMINQVVDFSCLSVNHG